ncbi:GNAT family N-acetyltransferase [Gorillibacterium timonense]|uniref:GNAT family N-acetyltransferase n=1 Tax=Gorillibacterium timonense TaxID=1689269 RepID=UPI00071D93D6|nr:GNAT family N-acetyltransferase [Gorillibacterium timonense]
MELLTRGIGAEEFEKNAGLARSKPNEFDKEFAKEFYWLALNNEKDRLWYRLRKFISVEENKIVGGALFKGAPNEKGEVEIGYGIDEEYQRQGYATEAIRETVKWALEQEGVLSVIAETEKDNIPSQKVLQNIGMMKYDETDTDYLWRV